MYADVARLVDSSKISEYSEDKAYDALVRENSSLIEVVLSLYIYKCTFIQFCKILAHNKAYDALAKILVL